MKHSANGLAFLTALLLSASPAVGISTHYSEPDPRHDEEELHSAGKATDLPSLLWLIRQCTPKHTDGPPIAALVHQLSDDSYAVREEASHQLINLGRAARPTLLAAAVSMDREMRARALACLEEIDKGRSARLPYLAIRCLLAQPPSDEITAVLLDYFPYAPVERIEDEIIRVLLPCAQASSPGHDLLQKALRGDDPRRRQLATLVLSTTGGATTREIERLAFHDPDVRVRLRAAQGLAAIGNPEALRALIHLLTDAPGDVAYEAHAVLCSLAADWPMTIESPSLQALIEADLGESCFSRWVCRYAWECQVSNPARTKRQVSPGVGWVLFSSAVRCRELARRFATAMLTQERDSTVVRLNFFNWKSEWERYRDSMMAMLSVPFYLYGEICRDTDTPDRAWDRFGREKSRHFMTLDDANRELYWCSWSDARKLRLAYPPIRFVGAPMAVEDFVSAYRFDDTDLLHMLPFHEVYVLRFRSNILTSHPTGALLIRVGGGKLKIAGLIMHWMP